MPTPRVRTLVSLAAAVIVALTLCGCARAPSRPAVRAPAPSDGSVPVVRFDNGARDYVHVYLVGQQREWLLGRVEPGARATLRIPEDALAANPGSMRIAVLAGGRVTLRAASETRAAISMAQPVTAIVSQRWTFSQTPTSGQLIPLQLGRARVEAARE